MAWHVSLGNCKDCGQQFPLTRTARAMDVARGLSEPERCPRCRKINAVTIRKYGAAYWQAPKETDPAKRCWGKYGLAYLIRPQVPREQVAYPSVDPDVPLRWLADPGSISDERDLWVAQKFHKIAEATKALVDNLNDPNGTRVSVLIGPTGTGKSTWAPYCILRSRIGELGRICVTQPRLITLRKAKGAQDDATTPGFIARHLLRATLPGGEIGVGAGHEIGFQYHGEYEQQDRYTRLLFVTDGTLINWLVNGSIGQFDVVFIDEAHELSRNMELIFSLLKYRLPSYPRMRVVIASATADIERFRNFFGNGEPSAVFLAEPKNRETGTIWPIHVHWLEDLSKRIPELLKLSVEQDPRKRADLLPSAVAALVRAITLDPDLSLLDKANRHGDILVFAATVPSVERIREAVKHANPDLDVIACHAQMTQDENKAFKRSEKRAERAQPNNRPTEPPRVLVATNYAETSVTFANLRYVIDSGLILEPIWDPKTCSNQFEPRRHSQAGCVQRMGRVGRVQAGECYRLFSRKEFSGFAVQTPPTMTRMPLDMFLLSAKAAGIDDIGAFQWIGRDMGDSVSQERQAEEFRRACSTLKRRGTFDEDEDVTNRGLELGFMRLPMVDLAHFLSEADTFACALEAATFLAFAGQPRGMFAREEAGAYGYGLWRSGCLDDLEFYLRIFRHWSSRSGSEAAAWAKSQGLSQDFLEGVEEFRDNNLSQFLRGAHTAITSRELDLKRLHRVRLVLARCFQEWVYVRRQDSDEQEALIFVPNSPDCPCEEAVAIERDSACYARSDLEAFVCVERTRSKHALLVKHVVRVNPAWLDAVRTARPIGLAFLLKRTCLIEERVIAERSEPTITAEPRIDFLRYKALATARQSAQARVLRHLKDNENPHGLGKILVEAVDDGAVMLAKAGNAKVDVGEILRVFVTGINEEVNRIEADQMRALEDYRRIAGKDHGPIKRRVVYIWLDKADPNRVLALNLELEPGIRGRLDRRNIEVRSHKQLNRASIGDLWRCMIKAVLPDGKIDLLTPEVFFGRRTPIKTGDVFRGVVQGFLSGNSGYDRDGVFVELVPGVSGLLRQRKIRHKELESIEEGDEFSVIVEDIYKDQGQIRYALALKDGEFAR